MTMHNNGLTKLMEECGELIQVAAKKAAYPDTLHHPDNHPNSLNERLAQELADVIAASIFVIEKFKLDQEAIELRTDTKLDLYRKWDNDPNV